MSTEPLSAEDIAGSKIDFAVWNTASPPLVLDFDDNTFKSLGSATTPSLAGTEQTVRGGGLESAFTASLDLALLNATPAVQAFYISAYRRASTDSAISTDLCIGTGEIRVASSARVADDAPIASVPGAVVRFDGALTSTAGTACNFMAWLEVAGVKIALPAEATCDIVCREFGSGDGVTLFDVDDDGDGPSVGSGLSTFEITQDSPGFTDDRMYQFDITIVADGVTYTGSTTMTAVGAA